MVHRPPPTTSFLGGQRHFTRNKQPPARLVTVDLVPSEEVRVFREQLLQPSLRSVVSFGHLDEIAVALHQVNTSAHRSYPCTRAHYFFAICRTFLSGGTRIRTGDTM